MNRININLEPELFDCSDSDSCSTNSTVSDFPKSLDLLVLDLTKEFLEDDDLSKYINDPMVRLSMYARNEGLEVLSNERFAVIYYETNKCHIDKMTDEYNYFPCDLAGLAVDFIESEKTVYLITRCEFGEYLYCIADKTLCKQALESDLGYPAGELKVLR